MGAEGINAFLTHLAVERNVAASTQTQALSAILFLYKHVLQEDDLHARPEPPGKTSRPEPGGPAENPTNYAVRGAGI